MGRGRPVLSSGEGDRTARDATSAPLRQVGPAEVGWGPPGPFRGGTGRPGVCAPSCAHPPGAGGGSGRSERAEASQRAAPSCELANFRGPRQVGPVVVAAHGHDASPPHPRHCRDPVPGTPARVAHSGSPPRRPDHLGRDHVRVPHPKPCLRRRPPSHRRARTVQPGPNATITMARNTATNTHPQRRAVLWSSSARTTGTTGTAPTTTARATSASVRRLTPPPPDGAGTSAGGTGTRANRPAAEHQPAHWSSGRSRPAGYCRPPVQRRATAGASVRASRSRGASRLVISGFPVVVIERRVREGGRLQSGDSKLESGH
ncbi:hypothetical protein EDD38_1500 [Kitasatospora cineracea]|uniref:Uncharacterized protein n=1 Tax=Kitasatospora cineracea TaxID=88074 RepID=A0A3N4RQR1_9ACTN|nr:hypothetical protein EDD38_1500 [Kitasatospora cineracea]